ncbi:MAG: DUF4139 domain-containing protein [Synergistaceae bacterium]|jgi:uncharacterized protein (TIGR02231 family)|nr:DUF4139 domain-containing protein [Synergistaceae bacterium]
MLRKIVRSCFAAALLPALLLCPSSIASAASPSVRAVDFYPAGAKFVFSVEADGDFEFDLPGAFDPDSVRCLTREHVASLEYDAVLVRETAPEELEELWRKIDDAKLALDLISGDRSAMMEAVSMLQTPPAPFTKKMSDAASRIEYIRRALEFRRQIENDMADLGMKESKARAEWEKVTQEFETRRQELESKKPFNSDMSIKARGTVVSPATLVFEARTNAAGWRVGYEMNMNGATGDIDAGMRAEAWQNTGLDAEGELSFHTRAPSFAVAPPEVLSLSVSLLDADRGRGLGAPAALDGMAPVAAAPPMPADSANYSQQQEALEVISTMANVTVKGRGRVGGDGDIARVEIGTFSMKSTPVLISIPEQNKEAWIIASMDMAPPPLLPGQAELTVDGAPSGRTVISESAADMMRIPFGMASRVTSKKEMSVSTEASTIFGQKTRNGGYTLEITNAMDTERKITVRDRMPIPTTDKITLEVKRIDPLPAERDKENRLTWEISLKPGETKKITVEYALKYSGDGVISYN